MNKKINIFVIEDNPGDLRLIKEMLRDSGIKFNLDSFGTLKEGLELFKEGNYDVLLLDLGLPNSKGIETFLKAHAEIPQQPIIILTGLSDEEQGLKAVSKGAQDYLIKGQVDGNLLSRSIKYAMERKKSEKMLLKEQEISKTYFDIAGVMMVVISDDKKIQAINQKGCELLEYPQEELLGQEWFDFLPSPDREQREKNFENILKGKLEPYLHNQQSLISKNGKKRIMSWNATPLKDIKGNINGLLMSGEDITKNKEYEAQIEESLLEKDTLLKEIHHRVKNNLQIISSLLNLQAEHISDKKILANFKDYQSRIKSISLVHEKLYRSEDIARINLGHYIEELCNDIMFNYMDKSNIQLEVNAVDALVNPDTAIPCGLIVNELVTNSFKHAFPSGADGKIEIILKKRGGDEFEMIIRDNGVGLDPKIDPKQLKTLGLELVSNLVRQLDGTLEIQNKNGAEFKIYFKEMVYEKRL